MKTVPFPFLALSSLLALLLTSGAPGVRLDSPFNGRDLNEWSGDRRLWRVENGVLIGETDEAARKIADSTYLIWNGPMPDDFELSLKVRVSANNSGVQYRSQVIDAEKHLMKGYQMDIFPKDEWQCQLYDTEGRAIVCYRGEEVHIAADGTRTVTKLPGEITPVDLSKWNDYKIIARGHTLTHWFNGQLAAKIIDMEEGKFFLKGSLGLQLHQGEPMKAEFKDFVLTDLTQKAADTAE